MTLIALGMFWLAGIYLGTQFVLPLEAGAALGVAAAALAGLWWRTPPIRLAMLGTIVLLVALTRSHAMQPAQIEQPLAPHMDRGPMLLRGVVADSPLPRGAASELRLAVAEIQPPGEEEWRAAGGTVLVRVPLYPSYRFGDYLELRGAIETPPSFDQFSYRDYLLRQGITGIVRYPRVTLLATDHGPPALARLHDLRATLSGVIGRALPDPQAALAQGILLGQRTAIPDDLMAAFNRTNTSHVIAISGTNVTLLAGILLLVGRTVFGQLGATVLAILGITGYALLVGPSPSVVRATIMGVIFAGGSYFGRPRDITAGLALAAVAMTFHDPPVLFDLGFQLSFLATAGLVFGAPIVQSALGRLPAWLGGLLAATIAAEAAAVPLIILYFGQVSLAGPFANLIVPPLLPAVMLSGAATAITGLLWPPLGQALGYVAWLFLSAMIWSVEGFGALPLAALPVGRPGVAVILAYYALLAAFLLHRLPPTTGLHAAWRALWARLPTIPSLGALSIAAALAWAAALTAPDAALHISVLDVGQGDAILIRTPQHKILIDGGPDPEALSNALGRRLPFWDRGLDLVVLSHANEDHLAGLVAALERFPVKQVLVPPAAGSSTTYLRWQELIRTHQIRQHVAEAGDEIDLGGEVRLRVLHPPREWDGKADLNEGSIVLRLTVGRFAALFTGDIGPAGTARIIAAGEELPATVLKVPHHGSATGLSPPLLDAVAPEMAIISAGKGNRFGHPAPPTLALLESRGVATYRTDLNGTVEVVVTGDGYAVRKQR